MLMTLCVCADIPTLHTRIRVELVLHHNEADKPTNTGRLACLALANSGIRIRGVRDQPMPTEGLQGVVLYPHDEATILQPGPTTLVVPDGTWNQASRIVRREPVIAALPRVRLQNVTGSPLQLRDPSRLDGLSTLEAIAAALGALGEHEAEAGLKALFALFVRRTLWSRGTLTL